MKQTMRSLDYSRLKQETFLRRVEFHERLASTNDLALQVLPEWRDDLPALIVAAHQTGGRGRGDNRWWASQGALTFSLLIQCDSARADLRHWPMQTMWTAIAVRQALQKFIPNGDIRLKWPNDVFVDNRKIVGILLEVHSQQPDLAVVGVGINVNNSIPPPDPSDSESEWRGRATSIRDITGEEAPMVDLLGEVLRQFERHSDQCETEPTTLGQRWRPHCFLSGRKVQWSSGTRTLNGICDGVADDGAIILRTNDRRERCYGGVIESY